MNFFILAADHDANAAAHADQHVGKALLEGCQMLCTAHPEPADREPWIAMAPPERLRRGLLPYKHTHVNSPCGLWTRRRPGNYVWLIHFAYALAREYEHRFGRAHASLAVVDWCAERACLVGFAESGATPSPHVQVMPERYRGTDAVEAYRRYYAAEKRVLRGMPATWTRRPRPEWFDQFEAVKA